jgi:hypothetical protein
MPKVSLADTFRDWDKLLTAAEKHRHGPGGIDEKIDALREEYERLRALDDLRLKLTAERQEATRQLYATRERGKDCAIMLRQALRSEIGPHSAALVELGMRPLRPRPRRRRGASAEAASGPASEAPPAAGGEA